MPHDCVWGAFIVRRIQHVAVCICLCIFGIVCVTNGKITCHRIAVLPSYCTPGVPGEFWSNFLPPIDQRAPRLHLVVHCSGTMCARERDTHAQPAAPRAMPQQHEHTYDTKQHAHAANICIYIYTSSSSSSSLCALLLCDTILGASAPAPAITSMCVFCVLHAHAHLAVTTFLPVFWVFSIRMRRACACTRECRCPAGRVVVALTQTLNMRHIVWHESKQTRSQTHTHTNTSQTYTTPNRNMFVYIYIYDMLCVYCTV